MLLNIFQRYGKSRLIDLMFQHYEKFIIINLSCGEWLIVLIIVLIFLSIAQLYEEKASNVTTIRGRGQKERLVAILEMKFSRRKSEGIREGPDGSKSL